MPIGLGRSLEGFKNIHDKPKIPSYQSLQRVVSWGGLVQLHILDRQIKKTSTISVTSVSYQVICRLLTHHWKQRLGISLPFPQPPHIVCCQNPVVDPTKAHPMHASCSSWNQNEGPRRRFTGYHQEKLPYYGLLEKRSEAMFFKQMCAPSKPPLNSTRHGQISEDSGNRSRQRHV